MGKDTCIISGDSITKLCARVSSMLITRVYEKTHADAFAGSYP
nr:hypothetical protein [Marinicella sp. W31]MDC2877308.1 hypothetical protein [Marinicella sp. W31]